MKIKTKTSVMAAMVLFVGLFGTTGAFAASEGMVYDEAAYTSYVQTTMKKLDRLYLQFCATCNVSGAKAYKARQEFLVTVRELLQKMNDKFDALDPKKGAALSPTETLVSIHVLTMLVDILTQTQIEAAAAHPYN
jgi:hypothetical protein